MFRRISPCLELTLSNEVSLILVPFFYIPFPNEKGLNLISSKLLVAV